MGTLAETWKQEGRDEGEVKGLAAGEALGREKGLAAGRAEGLAAGKAEGLAAGKAEGLAEGEARGEARSLMRLLVKRFGPLPELVVAQIAAGTVDDLDRWFDAAITASDIEAVFVERRDH